MGKASTNAGIHPYLKPDFISSITTSETQGIPFSTQQPEFMDSLINTEYKDLKNRDLYYKDEVEFEGSNYEINYDSKNFRWILVNSKKTIVLRDVYKKVILSKKYHVRINK